MFRSPMLLQSVKKTTTGIAGLGVHPNPRVALLDLYHKTLVEMKDIPDDVKYKKAVVELTHHRQKLVEQHEDVLELEKALNIGQIEEVIEIAKDELNLAAKMKEWKAWEPLEHAAPQGQWSHFTK